MTSLMRHFKEQPFVMATGIAALIHSAWSLGTLFSGAQPQISADITTQAGEWVRQHALLIAWLVPAVLIAFALDVGQIATSHEIRMGERNARKYATFAIFAVATYYLQWLYISHHMPALALGQGVSDAFRETAQHVRDLAVWVIPGLLPASTLLYTLSGGTHAHAQPQTHVEPDAAHAETHRDNPAPAVQVHAERTTHPALPEAAAQDTPALPERAQKSGGKAGRSTGEQEGRITQHADGTYTGACPFCDHVTRAFASEESVGASLRAHKRHHHPNLIVKIAQDA